MIREVVTNLIGNAVKFTKTKEVAEIEVGYKHQGDYNLFYVKDNGIGFDMKKSGKLFTVFSRLHSQEDYDGHGAGLAIVQRLLQRHKGKIWATSEPNIGTCFYFTLPKNISQKKAA